MNSSNSRVSPQSKQQLNLHHAFATLQDHCSGFLQNLSQNPLFNPNISSFHAHLYNSICNLQNQTKLTIDTAISHFNPNPPSSSKNPVWARIPHDTKPKIRTEGALSTEEIEERLAGVPVYALSNSDEEFVLVSGASTGKSIGLLSFKKEDAETLLEQMKIMDPAMRKGGSQVVPVALNKVFQLKIDGVAFRFIPEFSQVRNALKEREKAGLSDEFFSGVPVFQSRSLVLRSQNKSYRPVFFRKEDLENSLFRASREQNKLNPVFRPGDIQVAAFEDIIKGMKDSSTSTWNDVVFIPPGFDVSTDPTHQ